MTWNITETQQGATMAIHTARAIDGKPTVAGEAVIMMEARRGLLAIDHMPPNSRRAESPLPGILDFAELEAETKMAVLNDHFILSGETLRDLCRRVGLSGQALAARLGVDRNTVYRWQNGERDITPQVARHVALIILAELRR